jgi:hypothetical protein
MEATGGDLAGHDGEFLEVRWMPWSEAASLMTFDTERGIVDRSRPAVDALLARSVIEPRT